MPKNVVASFDNSRRQANSPGGGNERRKWARFTGQVEAEGTRESTKVENLERGRATKVNRDLLTDPRDSRRLVSLAGVTCSSAIPPFPGPEGRDWIPERVTRISIGFQNLPEPGKTGDWKSHLALREYSGDHREQSQRRIPPSTPSHSQPFCAILLHPSSSTHPHEFPVPGLLCCLQVG